MSSKIHRFDRSRRISAICLTIVVGLLTTSVVAGMIYFYYKTSRF